MQINAAMLKLTTFILILFASMGNSFCLAEMPDRVLSLSHPGVNWLLQFELPNAVEQYNNYKDGAGSYAYGQTIDQRKIFSMAIHNYPGATDAKSCRDAELANMRKNPQLASLKIDQSESGESAYLRTSGTVQFEGRSIFAQNIHRFVFRDGLCAKVHLSSILDERAVSTELEQAVDSMGIKDAVREILRSFHIPPKGALKLAMPRHWGFQTSNPSAAAGRTLTIDTPDGHFQFMATVFLAPSEQKGSAEIVTRKSVEIARDRALPIAVQTQIDVIPLNGRNAEGHFIFVTDKTLAGKPAVPNNWKHMRQGMLKIGAAFATFAVFSNDENSPDALRAMRVLEDVDFAPE